LHQKMESSANSSYNSEDEKAFMEDTMAKYYDEKLRRQYATVLQMEHKVVKEVESNTITTNKNSTMRILIIIGSILALAAAVYFVNTINQEPTQNYQVASNIDPYYTDIDFSQRGAITEAAKLVEIVNFYEEKDFAQVSAVYGTLESLEIEDKYLHAIAVSLAKNNELDEAINVWNILLNQEESRFSYHNTSRWFMGRAMIESGKYTEDGKAILSQVTANSEHYEDAQSLLRQTK